MATTKRVLVLNGYGNNLGDQAIFSGFANLLGTLSEELGVDLLVDQQFIYDTVLTREGIARINEEYDLLLLGGGGIIFRRANQLHDHPVSEWGFMCPDELIDELRTPLAIYAVGWNGYPFGAPGLSAEGVAHLNHTRRKAMHFSVREHGSEGKLRELGFDGKLEFVPDAALHVEPSEVPDCFGGAAKRPTLALCLRLDQPQFRFPAPAERSLEKFLQELVRAMQLLIRDGFRIVYVPHMLLPLDVKVGAILKGMLPADRFVAVSEWFPHLYQGASTDHPRVLAGIYRNADVVLGHRLHAVVLPFSVGTPVVSMSALPTNGWMLQELQGPPEHHINLANFAEEVDGRRIADRLLDAHSRRDELAACYGERKEELTTIARDATRKLLVDAFSL